MTSNAMMWILRMSIAVAMSVALVSCGRRSPSHVVGGGGSGGSADLWISGGHQFLYEGKPGVVFGMVKPRGQSRRFSYVLVFKHDFPNGSYSAPSNTSSSGGVGSVSQTLELNGRKMQLSYRIALGDESSPESSETLIVNDKNVPIADGIVIVRVVEGELEEIQVHGTRRFRPGYFRTYPPTLYISQASSPSTVLIPCGPRCAGLPGAQR